MKNFETRSVLSLVARWLVNHLSSMPQPLSSFFKTSTFHSTQPATVSLLNPSCLSRVRSRVGESCSSPSSSLGFNCYCQIHLVVAILP